MSRPPYHIHPSLVVNGICVQQKVRKTIFNMKSIFRTVNRMYGVLDASAKRGDKLAVQIDAWRQFQLNVEFRVHSTR